MVNIDSRDKFSVVSFNTDRINAFNVDTIRASITNQLEEQHNRIIIDLSGINYIDSTGFAMFLQFRRTAISSYTTIKLCGMSEHIKQLFSTLNLEHSFSIYPDIETAGDSF